MSGSRRRDPGLDTLLQLDGTVLVIDPAGKHWVKFTAKAVPADMARPNGVAYSLTLHDSAGRRLAGFDNAHPVRPVDGPSGPRRESYDHRHRLDSVRPYRYSDAMTLLSDFWNEVEFVLREENI